MFVAALECASTCSKNGLFIAIESGSEWKKLGFVGLSHLWGGVPKLWQYLSQAFKAVKKQ
jgi:hypothetical protein